jgi:hypothetical protein
VPTIDVHGGHAIGCAFAQPVGFAHPTIAVIKWIGHCGARQSTFMVDLVNTF